MNQNTLKVAVVGCGYWGPNLIRNFIQLNQSDVLWVSDLDQLRLDHMKQLYPSIRTTTVFDEILNDDRVDIIAIATPVRFHHSLAVKALHAGKHVFIEKPITKSVAEAQELIHLAAEKKLKLMVGHTFLYTSAVRKMKDIVDSGELGEIYYISAQRLNLGLFQQDINVLWDLAPHDLSIILYLLNQKPLTVNALEPRTSIRRLRMWPFCVCV
jgi:predicted dehydrogenase